MEKILYFVAFSALVACAAAVNCTGLPNGAYEKGCKSYAVCSGDPTPQIVDCTENMVFNNATGQCDDQANVPPPCGNLKDCTGKGDGLYADVDLNCRSFYTCNKEKFLGHNFCSADLVFDEKLNICNYADQVPPPCGTLMVGK